MDELKKRRIVSAVSVTSVIVFVLMLIALVWQIAVLGVKKAEAERLKEEIAVLEAQKSETEDEIELWQQDWKIEERARQLKG